MGTIEQRVALVTGSSKGVGAGIVRVLCRQGVRCLINCHSNPAMAEKTLERVREEGGEAFIFPADVSDPAQCRAMVRAAAEKYGRLDILVNNAAMQYNLFTDEYDEKLLAKQWNINLGGYWRMMKEAFPYLKESPQPRIINIGSVHGKRPTCFDAGYAMTKGGIRMLTREAALELAPYHIPVNCISLGGCRIEFKTGHPPFHSYRPAQTRNPDMRAPLRLIQPEEVGHLVWFLCSEKADAITGDCIRLDAGQMLT